ncbi:cyclin family protein [Sporobolomyces koalae]|uniref:cyclin family protein n=1 Tax=Sporobolomyces koalae TaxID=500713 RepID=UPI00317B4DA0
MSDPQAVCQSCGGIGTLVLEVASGTLACERCGTVSNDSSTATFEFLARVDEEDEFANGRTYVSESRTAWAGGVAASRVRALGGRGSQWAQSIGETTAMFHSKKAGELDKLLRRILFRFDAVSLHRTTKNLFAVMKGKLGFRWGYRAEVFAAACVYVEMRKVEREIWIQDLIDCCEPLNDPVHISRAIRIIKLEANILTKEIDPLMFVERVLVHLQKILQGPTPSFHFNKKMKPFSKKNLDWIIHLSLEQARTLALSLLRFSRDLYLVHGRAPEQVACAAVMVALEGIARRPCPKQQEFDDEMAWLTNTAAFTIQERYREYTKALTDYAPKLPWVAGKASKWKKKDVVEYTSDIVQFWKALDAKESKANAKRQAEEHPPDARRAKEEELEQSLIAAAEKEGEGGDVDEAEEEEEEEETVPQDLSFADPLKSKDDIYRYAVDSDRNEIASRTRYSTHDETLSKRPANYIRGSTDRARQRAAQEALAKGFGTHAPDSIRLGAPTSAASDSSENNGLVAIANELPVYGQKPEDIRAQLAPSAGKKNKLTRRDTRLSKLLWAKSAEEIDDDELFDEGELDSYLRTQEEAALVRRLPEYVNMVRYAIEQELKPKQPQRPRRRVRGQPNPEYEKVRQEAIARGGTINALLKARMKRDRGEVEPGELDQGEHELDLQREFRPRKKKTKVNEEARARLAALLASGASDNEDDETGHRQEGTDEWVGLAMNVAGGVDGGVVDVEGLDEDDSDDNDKDDGQSDTGGGDDDDSAWRKEFQYGAVDSDGYEDE